MGRIGEGKRKKQKGQFVTLWCGPGCGAAQGLVPAPDRVGRARKGQRRKGQEEKGASIGDRVGRVGAGKRKHGSRPYGR